MLLHVIWKDLLVSFKDKKDLIITLLMPAILIAILGTAFGGLMSDGIDIGKANIAIVNMCDSQRDMKKLEEFIGDSLIGGRIEEGQREEIMDFAGEFDFQEILFEEVLGNSEVSKFLEYRNMSHEEATAALGKGEITAIVVIPEGFMYDTFINLLMPFRNPVEIEIVKHPDHVLKGDLVEGILKGFTNALSAGIIAKNTFMEAAIENNMGDEAYGELESITKGIYETDVRDIEFNRITQEGKKAVSGFQYYAIGMVVMFILYAAANGAQYTIDEVRNNTFSRMILANTGLLRIFTSRFVSTTLFALVQISVLVLYSTLAFNINWGNFTDMSVLTLFLAVAVGGLSVFLSSINLRLKDARASIVFQAGVIQFMALIGGSFVPMNGAPFIQRIGNLTINGAAMQGYLKLMQGYHIYEITGILLTLAAFTTLSLGAGIVIAAGSKE